MATTVSQLPSSICILLILVGRCYADTCGANAPKNIFVLSGQSKMAGRGSVDELKAERAPDPRILRFSANLTWEVAADPLHGDIDTDPSKYKGVGPGLPFAMDPDFGIVGLVPCAIGATFISQWQKGTPLYETMVARARAALKAGGGEIRALLWYQGEADESPNLSVVYKAKLQKLISDVRADLQLPSLPIIEVAVDFLGSTPSNGTEIVRQAQLDTAVELPNVRCVDAKGLPLSPADGVHLTTASQLKLGAMMAEAFLNLTVD